MLNSLKQAIKIAIVVVSFFMTSSFLTALLCSSASISLPRLIVSTLFLVLGYYGGIFFGIIYQSQIINMTKLLVFISTLFVIIGTLLNVVLYKSMFSEPHPFIDRREAYRHQPSIQQQQVFQEVQQIETCSDANTNVPVVVEPHENMKMIGFKEDIQIDVYPPPTQIAQAPIVFGDNQFELEKQPQSQAWRIELSAPKMDEQIELRNQLNLEVQAIDFSVREDVVRYIYQSMEALKKGDANAALEKAIESIHYLKEMKAKLTYILEIQYDNQSVAEPLNYIRDVLEHQTQANLRIVRAFEFLAESLELPDQERAYALMLLSHLNIDSQNIEHAVQLGFSVLNDTMQVRLPMKQTVFPQPKEHKVVLHLAIARILMLYPKDNITLIEYHLEAFASTLFEQDGLLKSEDMYRVFESDNFKQLMRQIGEQTTRRYQEVCQKQAESPRKKKLVKKKKLNNQPVDDSYVLQFGSDRM